MIPMPLDTGKTTILTCCSKLICDGCDYANDIREEEASLDPECPFCRETRPSNYKGLDKQRMKRINMNDPVAMYEEGLVQDEKGDYSSAFEYFTKAAGLGNVDAHYKLSLLYDDGKGVEKDSRKEIHHLEEAAIGGHPIARHNLGCEEGGSGNIERAVKHFTIAANLGDDESIKALMDNFKDGFVSKDDLAAALRAHQAAADATKSPQREAAEEYCRIRRNGG
jgi:tetratricopeptide (TPR) repeat protein